MLPALSIFLFSLLIFIRGVSPSVYAGDSGDIILSSWFGGVAHPPGYPLQVMFGWVFTHLPIAGTIAYKANLLAAFLQAGVVAFFYLTVKKLTRNTLVSFVASMCLAFNLLFLLYAHIIEVFQLNLLLISISVFFLILWHESIAAKRERLKYLYISIAFIGIAVFHHHTSVLLAPAYIYFILSKKKKFLAEYKKILLLFVFFLLGAIPYIFTVWAAFRETPSNWGDPKSIVNLFRLITRADYGTFIPGAWFVGGELKERFTSLANFFLFLKSDFGYTASFFIIMGSVYCFFRERNLFWFLALAFFFTGPFFIFYSSFPSFGDQFFQGLWERFILVSYFFAAIFLSFGLLFIYNLVIYSRAKLNLVNIRKLLPIFVSLFLILIPVSMARNNYEKADLSKFHLGEWLAHDILASSEPNSILFLFGDSIVFNTEFFKYTNDIFGDRKVIKPSSLYRPDYRKLLIKEYPELTFPESFKDEGRNVLKSSLLLKELIDLNADKFPIYFSEGKPPTINLRLVSIGLLKKMIKSDDINNIDLVSVNNEIIEKFKYKEGTFVGYEHFLVNHLKAIYYLSFIDVANDLKVQNSLDSSLEYLNKARAILPDRKEAYFKMSGVLIAKRDCNEAMVNLDKARKIDPSDYLIVVSYASLFRDCYKDENKAKEYEELSKSLFDKRQNQELEKF